MEFARLVAFVRDVQRRLLTARRRKVAAGESPLVVFVSSVMNQEMTRWREAARDAVDRIPFATSWLFEFTPPSSEPPQDAYLRKVRESDLFLWIVGATTTAPVAREVHEALSSQRRIIVIRVATAREDETTTRLIDLVGSRAKWTEANDPSEMRALLLLTVHDEVVRALRGKPAYVRTSILEELARESVARCHVRFVALGVAEEDAAALVGDPSVGAVPLAVREKLHQPLVLLSAELGAGKSVLADRLFQESVRRASATAGAPLPVFLEARSVQGSLAEAVRRASVGLGDSRVWGVALVLDGLDEVPAERGRALVNEARVLVRTWPRSTCVATTRPVPQFYGATESTTVPSIPQEYAVRIVGAVRGSPVSLGEQHGWPKPVQDAIQRPLFAVLLGLFLKTRPHHRPNSVAVLVSSVVERAIGSTSLSRTAYEVLETTARLEIDRGASGVLPREAGTKDAVEAALATGLVVEERGALSYPLVLMREWFAARSVAKGSPSASEMAEDLARMDAWRSPIALALGTVDYSRALEIIGPIARSDPGLASQVLVRGLSDWGPSDAALPRAEECARMLLEAMELWVGAIGSLASLIGPVQHNGGLMMLGVRRSTDWLCVGWRKRVAGEGPYTLLRDDQPIDVLFRGGWNDALGTTPVDRPAWALMWTLTQLRRNLTEIVDRHEIPLLGGPLAHEAAWTAGQFLLRRGSLNPNQIPLDEVERRLEEYPPGVVLLNLGHTTYRLDRLREIISDLRSRGETALQPLWPGPNRYSGPYSWSGYSNDLLLARTRAVYQAALTEYGRLVDTWFKPFGHRLNTFAQMPVRFVSWLNPPSMDGPHERGPSLSWYLEALSQGSKNEVAIEMGPRNLIVRSQIGELAQRLRRERAYVAPEVGVSIHGQVLDVFGEQPATEIVYRWLRDDLKRLNWLDRD